MPEWGAARAVFRGKEEDCVRMRRRGWFTVLALTIVLVGGCGGADGARKASPAFADDGRLRVATSIYPIYEFARAVGGDRIDLVNLVPPGTEPHDWEPSVGDIRTLNAAQVFLYNGAGFEHWVDKALASLDNPDLRVVEASEGFALLEAAGHGHGHEGELVHDEHDADHAHEDADHHAHDHGDLDPHIWLDPTGAAHIVARIRDALAAADPGNAEVYRSRAEAYLAELRALDEAFAAGLARCERRVFFTTHAAFGYLAHRYGLEQHAIMGLSAEAEPTPRALKAVVEAAREHEAEYIFFETLVSDKVARVVADEIGAEVLVLNPFEGLTPEQIAAGEDYLSVMRQNLTNLRTAMGCR